jgi:single-stranded DNA-binding protein
MVNNLNSILIEGNLVRDSQLKIVQSDDMSFCTFTIAENWRGKNAARSVDNIIAAEI